MWGMIVFFAVIGMGSIVVVGVIAIAKGCEVLNEYIRKGN